MCYRDKTTEEVIALIDVMSEKISKGLGYARIGQNHGGEDGSWNRA
jgi:hypothetical protein